MFDVILFRLFVSSCILIPLVLDNPLHFHHVLVTFTVVFFLGLHFDKVSLCILVDHRVCVDLLILKDVLAPLFFFLCYTRMRSILCE